MEYGPGTVYADVPPSLGFEVGAQSYSKFLVSTVMYQDSRTISILVPYSKHSHLTKNSCQCYAHIYSKHGPYYQIPQIDLEMVLVTNLAPILGRSRVINRDILDDKGIHMLIALPESTSAPPRKGVIHGGFFGEIFGSHEVGLQAHL